MSWVTPYITKLAAGETVSFNPRGNSMVPHIHSGDSVTVRPLQEGEVLAPGAIVLCKVRGQQYLHFVSAVRKGQVQISNARGLVNGWTSLSNVFGIKTP